MPYALSTAICLSALAGAATAAQPAPPDLTAAGVIPTIDRKLTYNLGATGLRGWIYTKAANNLDAAQGRTTLASVRNTPAIYRKNVALTCYLPLVTPLSEEKISCGGH